MHLMNLVGALELARKLGAEPWPKGSRDVRTYPGIGEIRLAGVGWRISVMRLCALAPAHRFRRVGPWFESIRAFEVDRIAGLYAGLRRRDA